MTKKELIEENARVAMRLIEINKDLNRSNLKLELQEEKLKELRSKLGILEALPSREYLRNHLDDCNKVLRQREDKLTACYSRIKALKIFIQSLNNLTASVLQMQQEGD